jgi:predicted ester cyclase
MSTPEENKAAERRFNEEVWHKRNLAVIDELVAPDFVDHSPLPGQGPGREGFRQVGVELALAAFPDVRITIESLVAEGDMVVVRWTAEATHRGEFMGIPRLTRRFRWGRSKSTATRVAGGPRSGGSGTPWA